MNEHIEVYRVPATIDCVILLEVDVGHELSGGRWRYPNPGPDPSYVRKNCQRITGPVADAIILDWRAHEQRYQLAENPNQDGGTLRMAAELLGAWQ